MYSIGTIKNVGVSKWKGLKFMYLNDREKIGVPIMI